MNPAIPLLVVLALMIFAAWKLGTMPVDRAPEELVPWPPVRYSASFADLMWADATSIRWSIVGDPFAWGDWEPHVDCDLIRWADDGGPQP